MADGPSAFRAVERQYRALKGRPLDEVIAALRPVDPRAAAEDGRLERIAGDGGSGTVYRLGGRTGVYVLPDVLSVSEQAALFAACATEYPTGNASNLDALGVSAAGLWTAWEAAESETAVAAARREMERLRWVTLGLHYDWTAKEYPPGRASPFPTDLAALLTRRIALPLSRAIAAVEPPPTAAAAAAGGGASARCAAFVAEAAIVNYYRPSDTLMAHTDHSEEDTEAPLLSVSLGLPAIFLVGGLTRDEAPSAIVLRSGDAVVMEGASRLSFHGVPLVAGSPTPGDLGAALAGLPLGTVRTRLLAEFASTTRINVNVRQVFRRQSGLEPSGAG